MARTKVKSYLRKTKRGKRRVRQHTRRIKSKRRSLEKRLRWNYGSIFSKGEHQVIVGAKPKSPLTEEDIEQELEKIPEDEIGKIKRVNIAPAVSYIRKARPTQKRIPIEDEEDRGIGFVHPKRPMDVYILERDKQTIKEIKEATGKELPPLPKEKYLDALQHEIGHSLDADETKAIKEEMSRQAQKIEDPAEKELFVLHGKQLLEERADLKKRQIFENE